ncbi:hypothetical protein PVAP13_3KG016127 [Panicum virgatum]|uniref:Uncharacterized protein n=1 Tax=Panicum virgatum TaxID=38727 RepID=A0A8T0UK89_PANVG|nr:hypothetical protein PVAP13_3KG016127 [Panicum virgatum]
MKVYLFLGHYFLFQFYIFSVTPDKGCEHAVMLHPFHILMSTLGFSTLREDCIGQQQLCQYKESTST